MNKNKALAAIASLLLSTSTASFAGLTFKQTTESDSMRMTVQVSMDGGSTRVEYLDMPAGNPFMPPGSYMLVGEDGMFVVNPAERTYARFDMSMMAGMAQAMSQPGSPGAMELTNVRVNKLIDEAGETILGYPTRHYRFESSWTMAMAGAPMTMDVSAVEDVWVTDQIALPAGSAPVLDAMGLPEAVKELIEAQQLKEVDGLPLRHVTVQNVKANMGAGVPGGGLAERMVNRMMGASATTTTTEITDIDEIDIPASTFEIPGDYREISLLQR